MANTSISLRLADLADLPVVLQLLVDDEFGAHRDNQTADNIGIYEPAFSAIQSDFNSELLVAVRHSEIVGCLQLTVIPGLSHQGAMRCQIEDVRVRKDLRRQGIGRKILELVELRAKQRGCRLMQLLAHRDRVNARRFYIGAGYEDVHIGMRKRI